MSELKLRGVNYSRFSGQLQVHWQLLCVENIEQSNKNNSVTKKYLMTDTSEINWVYLAITVSLLWNKAEQKSSFLRGLKKTTIKNWVMSAYIPGWSSLKIIWQFDLDLELTLSLNKQYLSCEQQWKRKMK